MAYLPNPVTREEQYLYAIAKNNEEIQKQALLTQYVAAMADVYIPEEDADVQNITTASEVLFTGTVEKNGGTGEGTGETYGGRIPSTN